MKKKSNFSQGVYTVRNKEKYIGKSHPIFRSSWERKFMEYLDGNRGVKQWCSECVIIPYSFNGKNHRYFTDFLIIAEDDKKTVVEVKPLRETKPPRKTKKKSRKTFLYESFTYLKNQAKWEAADRFCKKKGWVFKVITEKDLI